VLAPQTDPPKTAQQKQRHTKKAPAHKQPTNPKRPDSGDSD
jgi:hypothetical protein